MHVQNPHMKMITLPKSSAFHCSNGHNRMFKPNIAEKYATFRIYMTTGQYILIYGSKTWTKGRWDENRISEAEIKIITGGYINLICKRHLEIMYYTTNRGIMRKLETSMEKTYFLNSWLPTKRMMILAYTSNAGTRHDRLHEPKCIYLRHAVAHIMNSFTTLD